MIELSKYIKTQRMQVWLEAWTKTASATNCTETSVATKYADVCLKEFDIRFCMEPKLKLCVEIMTFCYSTDKTTDMKPSELNPILSGLFGEDIVKEAISVITGEHPNH